MMCTHRFGLMICIHPLVDPLLWWILWWILWLTLQ